MKFQAVMWLLAVLLAGCTAINQEKNAYQAPNPPAPGEQVHATLQNQGQPLVARQFAGPDTELGPIPTLTIILKPYDRDRNAAACQEFLALPTVESVLASWPLAPNFLPLRWPLIAAPDNQQDCDSLLNKYDFYAGARLLGTITASAADSKGAKPDFSGKGPFIVEQYADEGGLHYVVLDLSQKDAATDFHALASDLANALSYQTKALNGTVNADAPPAAASNVFLDKVCGMLDSRIGKIVRFGLSLIPGVGQFMTIVDNGDKAGCPSGTNAKAT